MNKSTNNTGSVFGMAAFIVGMSGLLGILTNMVNGAVSPGYFKAVLHWNFEGIWMASVMQGLVEGLIYGVVIMLVLLIGFSLITKGNAQWNSIRRYVFRILLISIAGWVMVGLIALGISAMSPEYFHSMIKLAPAGGSEQLRFAWVGGSIMGCVWGGLIGTVLALVSMSRDFNSKISEPDSSL
jgi:hypothetical protein